MFQIFLYIFIFILLLLFFWPQRFEGYYSVEGWFVEWRAYMFKVYFSSTGSAFSFLHWKLKDSADGEEDEFSDELFEDPDFEPPLHTIKGNRVSSTEETEKPTRNVEPPQKKKDTTQTETPQTFYEKPKTEKDTEPETVTASLEERVEKKIESFFEQPTSDDDWDFDEDTDSKGGFSIASIKEKIAEWQELWEEYRKDVVKLLKWCKLLIVYLLKLLKPTIFQISLHGGLDNPADTGHFYAWFTNTFSFLPTYKWLYVHFIPQYGPNKEWKLDAKVLYKFNLLQLSFVLLLLTVTFPYFAYKRVKRKYKGEDVEPVAETA